MDRPYFTRASAKKLAKEETQRAKRRGAIMKRKPQRRGLMQLGGGKKTRSEVKAQMEPDIIIQRSKPTLLSIPLLEAMKFLDFATVNECRLVSRGWNQLVDQNRFRLTMFVSDGCSLGLADSVAINMLEGKYDVRCEPACLDYCRRDLSKNAFKLIRQPILLNESPHIHMSMHLPRSDGAQRMLNRRCMKRPTAKSKYSVVCENELRRYTVVPLLHWFKHLRSPLVLFSQVELRPFNRALWTATQPTNSGPQNDFIRCRELSINFSRPTEEIDWMAELCTRHVKAESIRWTLSWGAHEEDEVVLGRLVEFLLHGNVEGRLQRMSVYNRRAGHTLLAVLIEKFTALTEAHGDSLPYTLLPYFRSTTDERAKLQTNFSRVERVGRRDIMTYEFINESTGIMMEAAVGIWPTLPDSGRSTLTIRFFQKL